jgi:serine phosphatase RsbU (regulator of sigma subunit)
LSADGSRFNVDSLRKTLGGPYESAQTMLDAVLEKLNTFRGHRELEDDLTLVAIQLQHVTAPPEPAVAAA